MSDVNHDVKICIAIIQSRIMRNGHTPENERTLKHIDDIMKYFNVNLMDMTLHHTEYEKIWEKIREV